MNEEKRTALIVDDEDIVVLDMIMPDENGAHTYKRLKKMNPYIRALVSSGNDICGVRGDTESPSQAILRFPDKSLIFSGPPPSLRL